MKAVILNSGIGKRMKPFTDRNPKCFAEINGETLLERQIRILEEYSICDFIITTGPFESKIKGLIRKKFPKIKVTYVKNPLYETTNYIYSMFLAKGFTNDDIILMHGDMVFEKKLFERLVNSRHQNCVLVNNGMKLPEKDFKGRIENGVVKEIGVNIFGKNCFFLAPVYKFSKKSYGRWMDKIEDFVKIGHTNEYAENAFNTISSKIGLHPVYFKKELGMEIDTLKDLITARAYFKRMIN